MSISNMSNVFALSERTVGRDLDAVDERLVTDPIFRLHVNALAKAAIMTTIMQRWLKKGGGSGPV